MAALIVFGFPLLLFLGVGYALTRGQRRLAPDPNYVMPPPAPIPPPTRAEIIGQLLPFLVMIAAVGLLSLIANSLPSEPLWAGEVWGLPVKVRPVHLILPPLLLAGIVMNIRGRVGWKNWAFTLGWSLLLLSNVVQN